MKLIYFGLVAMMSAIANLSHASWDGYALITAKPVNVQFLSDLHNDDDEQGEDFFYGSLFEVTLTDIRVIYGSLESEKIDVELTATHREVLTKKKEIHVLLDLRGQQARVLYWGIPYSVICIPRKLIEEREIRDDFVIEDLRLNRLCTNAEWFQ